MRKPKEEKPVSDELIDQWLQQGRKPEDVQGLLREITKAILERALRGEMNERDDNLAVVLIHRASGIPKQEFATAEKIASPRFQAHLRAASASGADIYLTVNALKPGVSGRTKADVAAVRHVFSIWTAGARKRLTAS